MDEKHQRSKENNRRRSRKKREKSAAVRESIGNMMKELGHDVQSTHESVLMPQIRDIFEAMVKKKRLQETSVVINSSTQQPLSQTSSID